MRRNRKAGRFSSVPAIRGNPVPATVSESHVDMAQDSRFHIIQLECGQRMADAAMREFGFPLESGQPEISPILAGEFLNRAENLCLIMGGRLVQSKISFLLSLSSADCEKLLLFACGGKYWIRDNDFRSLFRPGGKALLSGIGEILMRSYAEGWSSLFGNETVEIGGTWTRPRSCRFFEANQPLALAELPFSTDGGAIAPKVALSVADLARVAPVFGIPGDCRVSMPEFRKAGGEAADDKGQPGFWERLKAFFGIEPEQRNKIVIFRELADRGATVCGIALDGEHPQLIAAVLSTFPGHLSKAVLEKLPMDTRRNVIERMTKIVIRQASLLLPIEKALVEKVENLQVLENSVSWR